MKNRIIFFVLVLGLFGFLPACEKDGDKVTMLENPVVPAIKTMPSLTLLRNDGAKTITFEGVAVDPGFEASTTYFLEAALKGTNFASPIQLYSGTEVDAISFKVADLNGVFLKYFKAEVPTAVQFRIRAVLVTDAGTGAKPFVYYSDVQEATVTLYGFPRLDVLNSGLNQKLESPLGNGVYSGLIKVDPTKPFTLKDPDSNTEYGANGGAIAVGSTGIVAPALGWHIVTVDVNALTINYNPYMIGIIGSATPTGWDSDTDMDYDSEGGFWYITINLVPGACKFRKNDGWGWNMGLVEGTANPGLEGPTQQGGVGNDIPITEAGSYTVKFYIYSDAAGKYQFVKN